MSHAARNHIESAGQDKGNCCYGDGDHDDDGNGDGGGGDAFGEVDVGTDAQKRTIIQSV